MSCEDVKALIGNFNIENFWEKIIFTNMVVFYIKLKHNKMVQTSSKWSQIIKTMKIYEECGTVFINFY